MDVKPLRIHAPPPNAASLSARPLMSARSNSSGRFSEDMRVLRPEKKTQEAWEKPGWPDKLEAWLVKKWATFKAKRAAKTA